MQTNTTPTATDGSDHRARRVRVGLFPFLDRIGVGEGQLQAISGELPTQASITCA